MFFGGLDNQVLTTNELCFLRFLRPKNPCFATAFFLQRNPPIEKPCIGMDEAKLVLGSHLNIHSKKFGQFKSKCWKKSKEDEQKITHVWYTFNIKSDNCGYRCHTWILWVLQYSNSNSCKKAFRKFQFKKHP